MLLLLLCGFFVLLARAMTDDDSTAVQSRLSDSQLGSYCSDGDRPAD